MREALGSVVHDLERAARVVLVGTGVGNGSKQAARLYWRGLRALASFVGVACARHFISNHFVVILHGPRSARGSSHECHDISRPVAVSPTEYRTQYSVDRGKEHAVAAVLPSSVNSDLAGL
eukprot:3183146-Prymnesium_polylepis.1